MFIRVRVRTKASRRVVKAQPDGSFLVWTTAAPDKGKANKDVIALLARHLGLPKSRLAITKGETTRDKTIEIRNAAG